jgi:hypothetical protein
MDATAGLLACAARDIMDRHGEGEHLQEEVARNNERRADLEKLIRHSQKLLPRHRRPTNVPCEPPRPAKTPHLLPGSQPAATVALAGGSAVDSARPAKVTHSRPGMATGVLGVLDRAYIKGREEDSGEEREHPSLHPPPKSGSRNRLLAAAAAPRPVVPPSVANPAPNSGTKVASNGDLPAQNVVECSMSGASGTHEIDVVRYSSTEELRTAMETLFPTPTTSEPMVLVAMDSVLESMRVTSVTPWPWLQRECRSLKLLKPGS